MNTSFMLCNVLLFSSFYSGLLSLKKMLIGTVKATLAMSLFSLYYFLECADSKILELQVISKSFEFAGIEPRTS